MDAIHFRFPACAEGRDEGLVRHFNVVTPNRPLKFLYCYLCVAGKRDCGVLVGVELADIDVDKPDGRILKGSFRCGSEITVPGADSNH